MRSFSHSRGVRKKVPLLIGLTGASGSGKTYSALRLATGITRVSGGEIFFIDTESNRALHYAPKDGEEASEGTFQFNHVPFGEPFSPLDYLAALKHCVDLGAGVVVVDSMSHEHEGPGGVLEMHDAEVQKRSKGDWQRANAVTFACWAEPKAQRRRLINSLLQLGVSVIFCFRAKQKTRLPTKAEKASGQREPLQLGWMPIAGDEFVFEMTANCLLLPGSNGTPTWSPEQPGERMMTKLPAQFSGILREGVQLSEAVGEQMAQWAAGAPTTPSPVDALLDRIAKADSAELELLKEELKIVKEMETIPAHDFQKIRAAWGRRNKQIARGETNE